MTILSVPMEEDYWITFPCNEVVQLDSIDIAIRSLICVWASGVELIVSIRMTIETVMKVARVILLIEAPSCWLLCALSN